MKQGFVKVAAVTPKIVVADTKENTALICAEIKKAEKEGAKIIVLPELCITGYTCSDLFLQEKMLRKCRGPFECIYVPTVIIFTKVKIIIKKCPKIE